MKKKIFCFDEECYQNYWSCNFKEVGKNNWRRFVIFYDTIDNKRSFSNYKALVDFLENEVKELVGYNNKSYDDTILSHLLQFNIKRGFAILPEKDITENIKSLSDEIINKDKNEQASEYIQTLRRFNKIKSRDLFLLFATIARKSLKQISINLKHNRIQDLPYEPSHIVLFEELSALSDYNDNDVIITEKLLFALKKEIKEREEIYNLTGIDVRNDNDTNIAKRILRQYYEKETNLTFEEYKELRTRYKKLNLSECISPKIKFKTKYYQNILKDIKSRVVDTTKRKDKKKDEEKEAFQYIVDSKYLNHTIAMGGIHSNNKSEIIEEDNEHLLLDFDVESYYPRIMINEKLYPKHLGAKFLNGFTKIVDERIEAKHQGLVSKALMLKISVNSAYGLTKSEYSWLYDPKVPLSVCINGELYLLMLIEAIETRTNCIIVYSNTDGITVKTPKSELNVLREIIKSWEQYTDFKMEENRYKRMILKDVNNYLIEAYKKDKEGNIKIELKEKGEFLNEIKLATGYEYPIVPLALREYFINNTSVADTINNNKDIYNFMRAEKSSVKFKMIHQKFGFGIKDYTTLQKNNRWIVTKGNKDEGKLYKIEYAVEEDENEEDLQESLFEIDYDNQIIVAKHELQKGYLTTIVNDVDESKDINDYKLNKKFYIKLVNAIIKKIEEKEEVEQLILI